jgi:hypothetical protein
LKQGGVIEDCDPSYAITEEGQHMNAVHGISHDPATRAYVEKRVKEGRSKSEVIRILKRYVAREVYKHLPRG